MYWVRACILVAAALAAVASPLEKRAVVQATYDDLDRFMQYASSAYSESCPSPLGNTLVTTLNDPATSTQGYIARDDARQELVVAFRGSQQTRDFILDANAILGGFYSPGVCQRLGACTLPFATFVHSGFLNAYNSVADSVIATVRAQLADGGPANGYALRTTGHSLGGALSSLAAVSLYKNFPGTPIKMYTYGQPRTGNGNYANHVNTLFGTDAYRVVHTFDRVPRIPPRGPFGTLYQHHAYEYWMNPDPAAPENVTMCNASGEDEQCSLSLGNPITSGPFSLEGHLTYFNRPSNASFCN